MRLFKRFTFWNSVVALFFIAGPLRPARAANLESDLRNKSVAVHYVYTVAANVSTNTLVVDLSTAPYEIGPTSWPNPTFQTGEIHLVGATIEIDKTAASTCTAKLGVVNFINSSTGSVSYFMELRNERNVSNTEPARIINTDNAYRNLKVVYPTGGIGDGSTPYLLTNTKVSGSTDIQNDVPIPAANTGLVSPGLGDLILTVTNGNVAVDVAVDVLYQLDNR